MNVTLKQQDWPQFLKFLGPPPNKSVGAYRNGWIADFPDDINFLSIFECGSGNNNTNWCNKKYDDLLKQATAEPDHRSGTTSTSRLRRCWTARTATCRSRRSTGTRSRYQVADERPRAGTSTRWTAIDLTKVSIG